MNRRFAKTLASLTLVGSPLAIATALYVAGCSDTDNNGDAGDGGKVDSGTSTGGTTTAGSTTGGADAATTLYDRLGQKKGITDAVDAIVKAEVADPEIASYFYFQGALPDGGSRPDHPTVGQIKSCLVNQLASVAGGPEKYPGVPADNAGWQCRDMTLSHKTLGIPGGTFDKFVSIAAGVLTTAKVSAADIATIGGVLNGTKTQVAQDTTRDSGSFDAAGQ